MLSKISGQQKLASVPSGGVAVSAAGAPAAADSAAAPAKEEGKILKLQNLPCLDHI